MAATLHELLPTAKKEARDGHPALLRLIMRYTTNRYSGPATAAANRGRKKAS